MDEVSRSSRAESRQRRYARDLHRALAVSIIIHLVLAFSANPSLVLRLISHNILIGYSGHPRRGELAPEDESGEDRVALVRVRRFTGPLTLTSLTLTGTRDREATASNPNRPLQGAPDPSAPAERNRRGGSGGSGGPLIFELGEDWTVLPASGPVAQSKRFQVLKIVRPRYPYAAIRNGVEGVVRLEVRVDSAGKVAAVRAVENSAHAGVLEQAAVQAMFLWVFKPYLVNSRPVPFTLLVPFRYRLTD